MEYSLVCILLIFISFQSTEQRKRSLRPKIWDEYFLRKTRSDDNKHAHLKHPYLADIVHSFLLFHHRLSYEAASHHCAGSVLARNHILTACHCLADLDPEVVIRSTRRYAIIVGSLANGTNFSQWRKAGQFAIHPLCGYYGASVSYDVGIVRLSEPLLYSSVVKPVKFFSFDRKILGDEYEKLVRSGTICDSPGWGTSRKNRSYQNFLVRREVVLINAQHCRTMFCTAKYRPEILCGQNFDARQQICAAAVRGVIPCFGDSGGPLICGGNIFGLVSWGGNCSADAPEVYTSPSVIVDFVKSHFLTMKAAVI
ncbi:Trypsin-5 [Nesidiocoris tenuis]|uniref:Trypsin-5 n=1 Tax=Nesidiocoris tenuis TaxID=355587 RepID=A0ABN7AFE7_9HEMI|nr:Trypsin-5 [Nesidiocoris tenuis]